MNDDLLYKGIAELLNVDVRVMELINPEIGEDIGSSSDYFHYGYYCTFPQYDELDDEVKTELSKYIDINTFPFSGKLFFNDGDLGNTKADPFGWKKSYDDEIWPLTHPKNKNEVKETIKYMLDLVNHHDEEIIKKSLILSTFSIIEGFVNEFIYSIIDKTNFDLLNLKTQELFLKLISCNLYNQNGRDKIYNNYSKNKLKPIPNMIIRNCLAHDITKSKIENDSIIYFDKNNEEQKCLISDLYNDFIKYVDGL